MNVQINQLVKSLLKKESLDECSLQELEQFAERHPYFGAAQLLLTKKLQEEKSERYDEQLQKTFLFFNNPLWVQHLLNETGNAEMIVKEKKEDQPEEIVLDTTAAETETQPFYELKTDEPSQQENSVAETITHGETAVVHIVHTVEEEQQIEPPPPPAENEKEQPAEKAKEELLFEPFHTVDYFASQGIKFKEEEKPVDKFSQQLKSFTGWLRTMKKLPLTEITKNVNTVAEKKVELLAEHSLDDKEVITEAMAEVWEKQGNRDKAVRIYDKLSLLDPSKSAYFAAKIDELKKNI